MPQQKPRMLQLTEFVSDQVAAESKTLLDRVMEVAKEYQSATDLADRIALEAELAELIAEALARTYRAGAVQGARPFGELLAS